MLNEVTIRFGTEKRNLAEIFRSGAEDGIQMEKSLENHRVYLVDLVKSFLPAKISVDTIENELLKVRGSAAGENMELVVSRLHKADVVAYPSCAKKVYERRRGSFFSSSTYQKRQLLATKWSRQSSRDKVVATKWSRCCLVTLVAKIGVDAAEIAPRQERERASQSLRPFQAARL